jgi:hypothetical protein
LHFHQRFGQRVNLLVEKPNSLASFFEQISGTELAIENALGSASADREPLSGLKRRTSLHPGQFASFDSLARGLGWNTVISVYCQFWLLLKRSAATFGAWNSEWAGLSPAGSHQLCLARRGRDASYLAPPAQIRT